MIIEDSLKQIREIIKSMRELNDHKEGLSWQSTIYFCEFLEQEVNRIDRNIILKSNTQKAIDQTNCFNK